MCLSFTLWRPNDEAMWRNSLPRDFSIGAIPMTQYLAEYLHLHLPPPIPPGIMPASLCCSRPETGRPRPSGLEGKRNCEADLMGNLTETPTDRVLTRKTRSGVGSATELQFRGGFDCECGQPPQLSWRNYFLLNKLVTRKYFLKLSIQQFAL